MMLFWNLIFCSTFKTALTMEKSSLKKKAKRMVYGALVFAWHKLTDTYWFLRFHRVIDYEQRQRSLSDSTDLNSPGAFTSEKLRKTQSYTAFPHINKKIHMLRWRTFPQLLPNILLQNYAPSIRRVLSQWIFSNNLRFVAFVPVWKLPFEYGLWNQ